MRFFFTACLFICCTLAAQKSKNSGGDDKVFTKVEIESGPDLQSWNAYLKKATLLPAAAAAGMPPGNYRVVVRFVIDKEGNLAEVKAKNNPGYALAERAENIILRYEGVWHSANQCGRNVKSYKEQVLEFVVGG